MGRRKLDRSYYFSSIVAYVRRREIQFETVAKPFVAGFRSERRLRGEWPSSDFDWPRGFARCYDRRRSIVLNSKGRLHLLDAFSPPFPFLLTYFLTYYVLGTRLSISSAISLSKSVLIRLSLFKDEKKIARDPVYLFISRVGIRAIKIPVILPVRIAVRKARPFGSCLAGAEEKGVRFDRPRVPLDDRTNLAIRLDR